MNNEIIKKVEETGVTKRVERDYLLPASIVISAVLLAGSWMYSAGLKASDISEGEVAAPESGDVPISTIEEAVLPSGGIVLPVVWGELGPALTSAGVIDDNKFREIYMQRGQFTDEYEMLISGNDNERIKITKDNAGYLLNLFWALGLANKNPILESGEMQNPAYGGAGNFASTGGWTIAQGNAMNHYSRHAFFTLTPAQQSLVDRVSRGIYRPCCNNSTHFPDCNHGMAMLGLLELMASKNVSEEIMWRTALAVNSYWFPDTYLVIATYMESRGIEWQDVNPQEVLGANYSSASGYAKVASQVTAPQKRGQGGCGVDAGNEPAAQNVKQGGCGI